MSNQIEDRRDYNMLLKYLESEFAHVKEKIDLVQMEQKATRKELTKLQEELQAHYNDEYPHKICRKNSERLKRIENILHLEQSEQTHSDGVKKGVYLSVKMIILILSSLGAIILWGLGVFEKIRGIL